jgi:hypothetical protein
MTDILQSPEINSLATLVEEVARSTEEGVKRFIEPASGTLRRAVSKRHHVVFGRRGSGKTSLLRKAAADLTLDRRPIAFVDLEPFKGHSYPDVLISVLITCFKRFKEWLETAAIHPASKKSFWETLFGTRPKRGAFNRRATRELASELENIIKELKEQLHLYDDTELQRVIRQGQESSLQSELGAEIGVPQVSRVSSKVEGADKTTSDEEIRETFRRSKIEFLLRHILEYQDIFKRISQVSGGDSFLFLDDLYHIRRSDQPQLLDYFHRIAKGNNLWLKIGTIRHRSQWYLHGDPPVGLKLGDDADEIDLDLTLEKYSLAEDFLAAILKNLVRECSAPPIDQFVADGAVNRLVIASGGVARDFLGIFRRSIDEALERRQRDPSHYRGPKIGAEDVNLAVGKYGELKLEEFKRDTLEDQQNLEQAFRRIRSFCTERANANCFLLDQDANDSEVALIQELVDLRLVHLVRSRVTVSGRTGKIYKAYMLDVSQYTGSRKRRKFQMLEFWRTGSKEQLRKASLIYDPSAFLEQAC